MKLTLEHDIKLPTGVLGLSATPDGGRAFVTCVDGSVNAVNFATGEAIPLERWHESYASGCVLLRDQQTLISAGYDGALLWHDLASGECTRRVQAHNFWSWRVALSPNANLLATVTGQYLPGGWKYEPAEEQEPSVKVFDTATGELVAQFAHTPPVLSCAFHPDGEQLAAANLMGDVRVWRLGRGNQPVSSWNSPDFTSWGKTKSHHYSGGVYSLAFSHGGDTLVGCGMGPIHDPMAGNGKMTWQRWDWRAGQLIDQIKDGQHGGGLMETIAWRPGHAQFVMAGRQAQGNWNAAVFAAADGELIHSLDTQSRITQAVFTADANTLILGAAEGQPERKDGEWGRWGQVQVYRMVETDV